MSFLDTLQDVVKGAALGVAALTALPVFGAGAALADKLTEDDN